MGQGKSNHISAAIVCRSYLQDQVGKFFLIVNHTLPGLILCIGYELRHRDGLIKMKV